MLFHAKMAQNLVAAGKRHDKLEAIWYLECLSKTYEHLADPGSERMAALDNLMSQKVYKIFGKLNVHSFI